MDCPKRITNKKRILTETKEVLPFLLLIDIEECFTNEDNCNFHATCNNTIGSFFCTCNRGYTGDGVNCSGKNKFACFVKPSLNVRLRKHQLTIRLWWRQVVKAGKHKKLKQRCRSFFWELPDSAQFMIEKINTLLSISKFFRV